MSILLPTDEAIDLAVQALRSGKLIGLPTETVYGIGANALDRDAVLATFRLKGRPADNPLIVHVSSLEQVQQIASSIPTFAYDLARAFWPGPLTLVLPKQPTISNEVTAGLNTVAVRVPSHPVALKILTRADIPVSAPSANTFMSLSPTRAEHIEQKIQDGLACVIDGGACEIGIESTVVDCSSTYPVVLRPGVISREQIEGVVGQVGNEAPRQRKSPGTYPRHYSPVTPVRIVERLERKDSGIVFSIPLNERQIQLPIDPLIAASLLYASLYALDRMNLSEILIQAPRDLPEWEAFWDRIRKAAG